MKPILKLILVTPLLFIALSSNCQNWKLSKEKDGILVYTAETESSYKMFKAEMTIDANLHGLIYLLKDAESIPKWMYKVDEFEIFTEANEKHWLSWSGVDMPWPVDDRDARGSAADDSGGACALSKSDAHSADARHLDEAHERLLLSSRRVQRCLSGRQRGVRRCDSK